MPFKYDMTLSYISAADQEVSVTTAEDGGLMIVTQELSDDKHQTRTFVQLDEVDNLIEMLQKLRHHTKERDAQEVL
jgi:cobyrinic acid a,c-diamide synthase